MILTGCLLQSRHLFMVGSHKLPQKYGNLDMDETALAAFEAAGFEAGDIIHITFGETALDIPYGTNYSDVDTGNLVIRNNGAMIIVTLNMGVDIASADFGTKLVEGLNFLAEGEAPYLFHCTEGKDRAGFTAIVVEALMGATYEEIVNDYMLTYENYYGVEKDGEQWTAIADSNVIASLTTVVCGKEKGADISSEDLSAAAEKYLTSNGMTAEQIKALKTKLSTSIEAPVTPLVVLEDDAVLTRIQLMGMLYDSVKAQGKGFAADGTWMFPLSFTDMAEIPEGFYESAAWLNMNKVVAGYTNGKLGPNDQVSREQAVTMLWNLAKALGVDVSVGEDTNILSYDDAFDISSYAVGAFQWACGAGVEGFANGDGEGHILPKNNVTFKQAKDFIKSFEEIK